jgi:hypothetical protein
MLYLTCVLMDFFSKIKIEHVGKVTECPYCETNGHIHLFQVKLFVLHNHKLLFVDIYIIIIIFLLLLLYSIIYWQ